MDDIKLAADARKILMRKHTEQIEKMECNFAVGCTLYIFVFFILLVFTKMKNELGFFCNIMFPGVSLHFGRLKRVYSKRNDLKFLSV